MVNVQRRIGITYTIITSPPWRLVYVAIGAKMSALRSVADHRARARERERERESARGRRDVSVREFID